MAVRNILKIGKDELLTKKSRPVEKIDDRIITLLDDMIETMHDANGVGLAAPQVGVLKRVVVIDIDQQLYELINPVIIRQAGGVVENEGCLSLPGRYAEVERPQKIVVEALNRKGNKFRVKGEGHLARALSHEIDHLEGVVITDKAIKFID